MNLKRIKYTSAVSVGVIALVMMLIMGFFLYYQVKMAMNSSVLSADQLAQLGALTPVNLFLMIPVIYGIVACLLTLVVIFVYNLVAKKFPIGWEVK